MRRTGLPAITHREDVPAGCPLTGHELRLMRLLADGCSYQQAALRLGRNASTIRSLAHNAYKRLNVSCAMQAVVACIKAGWFDETGGQLFPPTSEASDTMELKRMLRKLTQAVKDRRVSRLTIRQRVYLDAFESHLVAKTDVAKATTRSIMVTALENVLEEARLPKRRADGLARDVDASIRDVLRQR